MSGESCKGEPADNKNNSGGECAKRLAAVELTISYFRWRMRKAPRRGGTDNFIFPVAMRLGETPVLIPNTMVKTQAAEGTILETVWESRWLPDSNLKVPEGTFKWAYSSAG